MVRKWRNLLPLPDLNGIPGRTFDVHTSLEFANILGNLVRQTSKQASSTNRVKLLWFPEFSLPWWIAVYKTPKTNILWAPKYCIMYLTRLVNTWRILNTSPISCQKHFPHICISSQYKLQTSAAWFLEWGPDAHQLSARVYMPTYPPVLKNSKNQVWCMTMVLQKHEKNSKNWPEHP